MDRSKAFDLFFPSVLLIASFILRLNVSPDLGIRPDEYIYWSRGISTLAYNWQWSPDFMWDQPPLFMYLISFTILLFNSSLSMVRMIPVVAGSMAVVVTYFLGKAFYDRRVGILSSLFLAFSGFHILYSRTLMIESLVLLLTLLAIYFFWTGIVTGKSIAKALVGGIFLGLALDSKYTTLIVYPALLLFFLVARKEWNVRIFGRESLTYLLASLATFIPVLSALAAAGVNPFFWQLSGRFGTQFGMFGARTGKIGDFLIRGLQNYGSIVNYISPKDVSYQEAVFPGYTIFLNVGIVLAVLIGLYFLALFFKRRREETMLMILFVVFGAFFVVYPVKFQYYWLYTYVAFPTMIAAFVIAAIDHGKSLKGRRTRTYQIIVRGGVLVLSAFVLMSSMMGGIISSQISSGTNDELIPAIKYIENHNGTGSYVGAGTYTPFDKMIEFYLSLYDINASVIRLDKVTLRVEPPNQLIQESPFRTESWIEQVVSLDAVHSYHPRFIVENRLYYESKYTSAMKQELAKNYRVAFDGELIFLFESVNSTAQSPSQQQTLEQQALEADESVLRQTLPRNALLGVIYQPKIVVKNILKEDVDVTVSLQASMQHFLFSPESVILHLNPGETQVAEFSLIGHRESSTPLDMSVLLNTRTSDGRTVTQTMTEQTKIVKQDFTIYYLISIIIITSVAISVSVFYRKHRNRVQKDSR